MRQVTAMRPEQDDRYDSTQTEPDSRHQPDEPHQSPTVEPELVAQPRLGRSRVGGFWVGLILGALVLVVLLVFILQNGQRAQLSFFGAQGQVPLGVAMLLAALAGALIVAVPGSIRIVQLRRATKAARRVPVSRP
jgi:uncharacterized integral membrane protein